MSSDHGSRLRDQLKDGDDGCQTLSWARWYSLARYEMAFRYGVRGISKDRYKEQFALGHTPQHAGRELMQLQGFKS